VRLSLIFSLFPVPLVVETAEIESEDDDNSELDEVASYHAPNSHSVRRRLIRLVEERPSNVASAVSKKENSVGDDLLGMTCRVCSAERKDKHKSSIIRSGQIVARRLSARNTTVT